MITFKGIEEERLGEAPFIGALLLAADCFGSCPGCFNQHIKTLPDVTMTADEILDQVAQNPLHEGIIFGGLEWTEQPADLLFLIGKAMARKYQVMLYTSRTEQELFKEIPDLKGVPMWIKFGAYDESRRVYDYASYGVLLASGNQYIKYCK